jgi:ABC-type Fe3+/spermidine/putrescine transport system ATPase subunit
VTLAIRPEKVVIADGPDVELGNLFTGTVTEVNYQGSETRLLIRQNDTHIRVTVPNPRLQIPPWIAGDSIHFSFPPDNLILMDAR